MDLTVVTKMEGKLINQFKDNLTELKIIKKEIEKNEKQRNIQNV